MYIDDAGLAYGLIGLRYIDLRTQLFSSEPLLNEALDKYTFIRDAYLQHRNYLIAGTEQDTGTSFVEDTKANKTAMQESTASNNQLGSDYVDE